MVGVAVVVVVVLEVLLLLAAAVLEEELVVPVVLPVEAGAPGSLSMVPSALLTFDPRLF